jgi:hypothetical protein
VTPISVLFRPRDPARRGPVTAHADPDACGAPRVDVALSIRSRMLAHTRFAVRVESGRAETAMHSQYSQR